MRCHLTSGRECLIMGCAMANFDSEFMFLLLPCSNSILIVIAIVAIAERPNATYDLSSGAPVQHMYSRACDPRASA